MATSPLLGARLKVRRSKHHVDDVEREILSFVETEPYRVVADIDPKTGDEVYRAKIVKEPRPQLSAIIGDALHNMRAALDLVATAVVTANGGDGNKAYFPFGNSLQHFESELAQKLKGASQAAVDLVRAWKPYKGGNTRLWQLHRLDRLDKHQMIIPVGAAHRSVTPDFLGVGELLPGASRKKTLEALSGIKVELKPADRQFPMTDGAEVYRVLAAARSEVKGNIGFKFDVAFGEGQIVDGQEVMPTLLRFGKLVQDIVDDFGRTIFNEGKAP